MPHISHMPESCDFCEIHTETDRIIRRDELVTSFLSNPRLVAGHVLIIPNRHVAPPDQLTDAEVLATHREADRITKIMLGSKALGGMGARGVDRWQKTRPDVAEGSIKRHHFHLHLFSSSPGQTIYDYGIEWGGDDWEALDPLEAAEMVSLFADLRQ